MNPKVTVLMSVYNTRAEYLKEAINSILSQTFEDYEFLIIDDGCCYETSRILQSYDDKRIKLIRNTVNVGLTASLNIGLELAKGEYIARMDADDYSYPSRLEETYYYMEKHNKINILGTFVRDGDRIITSLCGVSWNARRALLLLGNNGVIHSSVMIRKSFLKGYKINYDEAFRKAQDYDLWARCIDYTNIYVYPRVLLRYRNHDQRISVINADEQDGYANRVKIRLLKRIGANISDESIVRIVKYKDDMSKSRTELKTELDKLWRANKRNNIYSCLWLDYVLAWYLFKNITHHSSGTELVRGFVAMLFNRRFYAFVYCFVMLRLIEKYHLAIGILCEKDYYLCGEKND